MFISQFSVENWQGSQNPGRVQPVREWQEIATAIRQLDGDCKTLVTLEADVEIHMESWWRQR